MPLLLHLRLLPQRQPQPLQNQRHHRPRTIHLLHRRHRRRLLPRWCFLPRLSAPLGAWRRFSDRAAMQCVRMMSFNRLPPRSATGILRRRLRRRSVREDPLMFFFFLAFFALPLLMTRQSFTMLRLCACVRVQATFPHPPQPPRRLALLTSSTFTTCSKLRSLLTFRSTCLRGRLL